jgi:hypothetical protein
VPPDRKPDNAQGTAEDGRESHAVEVEQAGHVLLTRGQAARRMGVSLATVRHMEGAELQPVIVGGKHCFSIEDVDRHRRVTDGDLAAAAFQMFNDDKSQVDVVIALKEPPERIRTLFNDWVQMTGCIVAAPPPLGARHLWKPTRLRLTRAVVSVCVSLVGDHLAQRVCMGSDLRSKQPHRRHCDLVNYCVRDMRARRARRLFRPKCR